MSHPQQSESIAIAAYAALTAHGVDDALATIASKILGRDVMGLERTPQDQRHMREVTAILNGLTLEQYDAALTVREKAA